MAITSLNSVNQLMFVMVKCGVLFEVRTGFLNIIETIFGFKGLKVIQCEFIHSQALIVHDGPLASLFGVS
jgi:hypothetical protein